MKLRQVAESYDRAARHYDRLADLAFDRVLGIEQYRTTAVDLLGDLNGATVLDIGCGTGRNLPLLVPRVGPSGRVVGIDYSDGMLEQARRRVSRARWQNVEIVRGDAVELDKVPSQVDAVVSVWCFGILYDLEAALERALEVLRPGGRIAIMDFSKVKPDHGPVRWLAPAYGFVLQRAGIDAPEDLDDDRFRARWDRGRQLLRRRLDHVVELPYLFGMGFIIAGTLRDESQSAQTGRTAHAVK